MIDFSDRGFARLEYSSHQDLQEFKEVSVSAQTVIGLLLLAFLAGAVPFGWIVARVRFDTDIRRHGSQNTGATNVARTLGMKAGAAVLLLDAAKAYFVVRMVQAIAPHAPLAAPLAGAAAVFGHIFSPYLRFRGGKGVAAGLGAAAALAPLIAAASLAVFGLLAARTRIVSLSSGAAILAVLAGFGVGRHWPGFWGYALPSAAATLYAHRSNWNRLIRGEEPRFGRQ